MAKRIFEFVCPQGHISEAYVDSDTRTTQCKECDQTASRIISATSVKLEGVTGAFPGAYHSWERKRAEKLKAEQKKNAG